MKKEQQLVVNDDVENIMARHAVDYRYSQDRCGERLRSCNAVVIRGENGYWLRSYRTIIAFIPFYETVHPLYGYVERGTCYDFLRYVYGYTATSSQHISKFARDYGNGTVLSWKYV